MIPLRTRIAASKRGGETRKRLNQVRRATEFKFHCSVADFLDLVLPDDADWCHTPNGGFRTAAEGGKLKAMGVKAGDPDIRLIYQGRVYFIELKRVGGTVSVSQIARGVHLQRCGARVRKAETLEQVQDALKAFGIPIKQANIEGRAA
jgi:hypothetical protein